MAAFAPVPGVRAATEAVDEVGRAFQPAQLEVVVGDTVVWTNRSTTAHSVDFQRGPDLHPDLRPGAPRRPVGVPGTGRHRPAHVHGGAATTPTCASSTRYEWRGGRLAAAAPAPRRPASTTTPGTDRPPRPGATSSTTSTTRALATSSTVVKSSTTTSDTSSVLLPGRRPAVRGGERNSATGQSGGSSEDGGDSTTVALIVGLLLAVSAGGGYLLWRLRPGRA